MRKNILFLALFLVLTQPIYAETMIINTESWVEAYLSMQYGIKEGISDIYFLTNLNDAELVSRLINKDDRIIIFENRDEYVVKNYESFLEVKGAKDSETIYFNDEFDLQKQISDRLSIKKYFVINEEGKDAISAFPYCLKHECLVTFYKRENLGDLVGLLRNSNEVILYGSFKPSVIRELDQFNLRRIDEGSSSLNNLKLVEEYLSLYGNSNFAILSNGNYFEPGFLSFGQPIVIYGGSVDEIVSFSLENNITKYEVIGADMMNVGQNLRDFSQKKIGVVVKYGQTYVGIPGLRGKVYEMKVVEVPEFLVNMNIVDSIYIKDKSLYTIVINNTGEGDGEFYLVGADVYFKDQRVGRFSGDYAHLIIPGETFTITLELDEGEYSELLSELIVLFGDEKPLLNYILNEGSSELPYKINTRIIDTYEDKSQMCLEDFYYNLDEGFKVKIKNCGEVDAYADVEILMTSGEVFSYLGKEFLGRGETKELTVEEFYGGDDNVSSVVIYSGINKDFMITQTKDESKTVKDFRMEESSNIGLIIIILALMVVGVVVYLYLYKKNKFLDFIEKLPLMRPKGYRGFRIRIFR